ncbi:hypothetical protein RVR_3160 [Actinacidiphila reveromycinica]|uniref:Uncharacterized protein n=1 Tax=Actinacidiphila reveromycinica TaxID=659352 RepID=A0A7U3VN99_9ACTN|nr:hypothetical protein [Streptomyces sp. SN-593]BBA97422.1 hypothetical protein RVR_3160 [Streptomyces sp. SN-593]
MSHDPSQPGPYGDRAQGGGYGPPQPGYGSPLPPGPAASGNGNGNGSGSGSGSGSGRRNGIVIGAVVALVAIGAGVFFATRGGGSSSALHDDGEKYTLTTPDTVAGTYTRADQSAGANPGLLDGDVSRLEALGVTDPVQVAGTYVTGNVATGKYLYLNGVHGDVKDPAKAVDGMIGLFAADRARARKDGSTIVPTGDAQSVQPAGLKPDALVKCQKVTETTPVDGQQVPNHTTVCAWADYSTVGYLLAYDSSQSAMGTPAVSIPALAALTAKVRDDVEVPAS